VKPLEARQSSGVESVLTPRGQSRSTRAVLFLLTIGALLYVGMHSRVAHRIPTRSTQELLTCGSEPVKFPPPEERTIAGPCDTPACGDLLLPKPAVILFSEFPSSVLYNGERRATGNPLRGPPASF
jgi:hypothetical protein